jgi:hypothetical protein
MCSRIWSEIAATDFGILSRPSQLTPRCWGYIAVLLPELFGLPRDPSHSSLHGRRDDGRVASDICDLHLQLEGH